jgi:MFS family permease
LHALFARADLLGFGYLLTFGSCLGQTWFIALFATHIRGSLDLSVGAFGTLYSLATLASGATLAWIGPRLDHRPVRPFALSVATGLALAAIGMAFGFATWWLLVVLYLLRLCGQGLMSHVAMITTARGFIAGRGKALTVVSLGYATGEALLPPLLVAAVAVVGWRQVWLAGGLLLALVAWTLLPLLSRRAAIVPQASAAVTGFNRSEFLRDPVFLLILPAILAPGFVLTAIFFHSSVLAAAKGWSLAWMASCITAYALCSLSSNILSGILVDRFGATRLLPLFLLPLLCGTAVLALASPPVAAMAGMMLAGVSAGSNATVVTAGLAELFGMERLGTVRALTGSTSIVSSALSPALLGWALDGGIGIGGLLLACAGLGLAACACAGRGVGLAARLGSRAATA